MTDEELERLARTATPGPWEVDGSISVMGDVTPETWEEVCITGDFMGSDDGDKKAQNEANARYIAAFNPVTTLALLERVRKAEAKVEHLRLVGTGLANVSYSLKQQGYIPEDHRRSLDEGQRAWDAVLAGGATPTTIPARRPSPSTEPVDMARRDALVSALRLAEDVEREEKEGGRTDSASGAEEVKDRIKDRIRWLDEVRAALDAGGWVR